MTVARLYASERVTGNFLPMLGMCSGLEEVASCAGNGEGGPEPSRGTAKKKAVADAACSAILLQADDVKGYDTEIANCRVGYQPPDEVQGPARHTSETQHFSFSFLLF